MPEYLTRSKWNERVRVIGAGLAGFLLAIGAVVVIDDTPSPPPPPPSSTTTTAKPLPSSEWVRRLDNAGPLTVNLGLRPDHDYSIPVHDITTATPGLCRRVFQKSATFVGNHNLGTACIPWNDSWRPSNGFDGFMILFDPATGAEIDLWNVSWPGYQTTQNQSAGCWTVRNVWQTYPPFDINRDACAASAIRITQPDGKVADVRTYTGNSPTISGVGIHNLRGLLRPDNLRTGTMSFPVKTMIPNTMFGPECSTVDREDPTKFGVTCGSAVAPAGQFERAGHIDADTAVQGATALERRRNTVAEGMHFKRRLTDAQIAGWASASPEPLRTTKTNLARILRDTGMMVTDTGDAPVTLFQADGSPSAQQQYRQLGITGDGTTLLDGLPGVWELQPNWVNTCAGEVTSRWYCWASASAVAS